MIHTHSLHDIFHRQGNGKSGSLAQFASDTDFTLVLLNNVIRNTETQARARADFFGGEERFEDPFENLFRNTSPGVGNLNRNLTNSMF